ncbi:MAG: cytochrome c [Steroidobacteraceae bacterium]
MAYTRGNANRVLAFRLDGGPVPIPPELPPVAPIPPPPAMIGTPAEIQAGAALFAANCSHCHANAPRAPVPDLRRSALLGDEAAFQSVVRGGALQERGMPRWDDLLSEGDVHLVRAWLVSIARQGYDAERRDRP